MAEMPDVIGGEVVSSDWGNDIRDRTVQRYAETTERAAEHPAPSPGDLSYLESTDRVYVWSGSAWVWVGQLAAGEISTGLIADRSITGAKLVDHILASLVLVQSAVSEGPDGIPSSLTTLSSANVSVSIPVDWDSWGCSVHGHTMVTQTADSTSAPSDRLVFNIVIDGVDNEFHSSQVGRQAFGGNFGVAGSRLTVPLNAVRAGMTTTGSRTVTVQRARNGLDNVYQMSPTLLVVMAYRIT